MITTTIVALTLGLTPGAAGVGDPYFPQAGNGGFDVAHYDIDLTYARAGITATTTVTARATQGLSRFDLDFVGLKITSLKVDGTAAKYTRSGQELTVIPAVGIPAGRTFTVTVAYRGAPNPLADPLLGRSGWLPSPDGVVTLSEPAGSASWFPVSDHPSDKATFAYRIRVPRGLSVLANGERDGDRWVVREPMAPYLAFIAIGKWDVREGRTPGGIPSVVAIDPALHESTDTLFERVGTTTDWGVKVFGPYPFGSTGAVVDDLVTGYALETQNRPFLSSNQNDLATIVHELAHQWFGDSVSVARWQDIWLNEGFASYAEWLFDEQHDGPSAQSRFDRLYAQGQDWPGWKVTTGDPGRDRLFSGPGIYQRGAMAVHAVRTAIGDRAFFRLLPAWTAKYRHGNATVQDFQALAEQISGTDLDTVFREWLFTASKPRVVKPATV
ncbi:M1 family metallopeptidase [Actinocorallia longicatena]|uniref:Aminopeptidase N n=1 Tax=Actinocorallia longicatena TaxID=111803 RepID=A0ABP6Q1J4_9ACTN